MMHASFVLGGVRALGSTGNRRYLEIVAAVTLLSAFPSLVATILTMYHFFYNVDMGSLIQTMVCCGMLCVTTCSAYYAMRSLHYSEQQTTTDKRTTKTHQHLLPWLGTKTSLIAVSSLQERMHSASIMFEKTVGKIRMNDWKRKSTMGYNILYFEIVFHFVTNMVYLSQRMQPYGSTAVHLRIDETVGSLVESTSLALHWGFLLGNAFHGLRSYSPQCLDIYCWGKLLLVGATLTNQFSTGGGNTSSNNGRGGGGGLSTTWVFLEIVMHVSTVIVIRRVRFSIGTSTPTHETLYSCHKGTLSAREEHAMSLWDAASHHMSATGNGNTFRWYWFGRSAALFAFGCFLTMAIQCAMLVVLSIDSSVGLSVGPSMELVALSATKKEVLRTFGVGMNFAIHAAAMCMLALYRPTRDRFGYEHSRGFNIGVCMLFCLLFVWQILCAWPSDRLILNSVVMFNSMRIFVYAACGTSFWLTPKRMPDLLMFAARPKKEGPSAPTTSIGIGIGIGTTATTATTATIAATTTTTTTATTTAATTTTVAMPSLNVTSFTSPTASMVSPKNTINTRATVAKNWLIHCCISFGFVQWSGADGVGTTYERSNVKTLPLPIRNVIVKADRWTRISFWLYVVLAIVLSASDGYWLGSHGTQPFVNIGCLTMPSQICFHYCFILTGYALKGLRSPHVPMLKLICACTSFLVTIAMVTALAFFHVAQYWMAVQLFTIGTCLGLSCWYSWAASVIMVQNPSMFPKSGVSHNWM